jgi:hypothetical protein
MSECRVIVFPRSGTAGRSGCVDNLLPRGDEVVGLGWLEWHEGELGV